MFVCIIKRGAYTRRPSSIIKIVIKQRTLYSAAKRSRQYQKHRSFSIHFSVKWFTSGRTDFHSNIPKNERVCLSFAVFPFRTYKTAMWIYECFGAIPVNLLRKSLRAFEPKKFSEKVSNWKCICAWTANSDVVNMWKFLFGLNELVK